MYMTMIISRNYECKNFLLIRINLNLSPNTLNTPIVLVEHKIQCAAICDSSIELIFKQLYKATRAR